MKFGLLLPHFGEHADKEKLLEGSKLAEDLGFDSVWVRDHLVFEPHGEMEKPNRTFYDALTTLTAIGAVTETHRAGHRVADPVPSPAGDGVDGRHHHPVGRPAPDPRLRRRHLRPRVRGHRAGASVDRVELVRSNAEILRRVFTENDVNYTDRELHLRATSRSSRSRSAAGCRSGTAAATPRSARLAVEFCDGWMPGRISLAHHGQADRHHARSVRRAGRDHADDRGDPADQHRGDPRRGAEARQHSRPAGMGEQGQVRRQAAVGQRSRRSRISRAS